MQINIEKGFPRPYGASRQTAGINFALFSKHATRVTLCLFDGSSRQLQHEISLDPLLNRTGSVWHILLSDLPKDILYAYRIEGPREPPRRFAYDPEKLLLDPYAREVATGHTWGMHADGYVPLGRLPPPEPFDWQGCQSPRLAPHDLIIYEMHVRAFTQHPSSQVKHPGTFLGVIEKIPHLLELGVNAIELMPIHEFNENEVKLINPHTRQRLVNFWGYSSVNYFALMNRYATSDAPGAAIVEFKTMVREMHRHGIQVILDVVFNHTAEGNEEGPTLSYKGIDNPVYYILDDKNGYYNGTGCGNTFHCNHPVSIELILESLRYFVLEMHVDGFRFDLASSLVRGKNGVPLKPVPLITAISEDPILADTLLIAEPWDAVGLYHVGHFYPQEKRWSEWNDRYRDTVRQFIKGSPGSKGIFITRLCGSEDLYYNRSPLSSLNFVTAHDGFSLYDLVSYNEKHNLENGEQGRDGASNNESWNCGEEGPSEQFPVNELRQRQMRNLYLALMVSMGIPMVVMGDEYGHTKLGNNNTWCQDNDLSWFRWDRMAAAPEFTRYCKVLNKFRLSNKLLRRTTFLKPQEALWHGIEPLKPDWSPNCPFVALTLLDSEKNNDLYIAFNAHSEPLRVTLPEPPSGKSWHLIVNTGGKPPHDVYEEDHSPAIEKLTHPFHGYSALVLKAL